MLYDLATVVDVLDQLGGGGTPTQAELVRGAIALALFCKSAGEKPHLIEMLAMLENLALGRVVEFDKQAQDRAKALASLLRRRVGVH